MTKFAKPGSLRKYVEDKISAIQGYENIDKILKSKGADYLLYGRRVIVEQKEFENSPQHRKKGSRMQAYSEQLFEKYGINPISQDRSYLSEKYKLLSEEEATHLSKLRNDFYDKIKDDIRDANKQIESTKKALGLPEATGVVLMIFDRINSIMPSVIENRVGRIFGAQQNGEPLYKHVDVFIFALWMKDMLYDGADYLNGQMTRSGSAEHIEHARNILDALKVGQTRVRSRRMANRNDIVDQLVPDLFSE